MISREATLHQQVCDYIRLKYPNVIFRTDFAAGIRMTMGQAAKHKRLQSGRAYPDLFIAEVKFDNTLGGEFPLFYAGLFLELKATYIYLRDGKTLRADKHLNEQNDMLERLRTKGYKAEFAIGFDQAQRIIDEYLGGDKVTTGTDSF